MPVEIRLLGRFDVVVDGRLVPAGSWSRRHAAHLVKLLALSHQRTLHREQVLDLLWPDDNLEQATPKLHKAAHFARRATDRTDAVVVRGETLRLFPDDEVVVDAVEFEARGRAALNAGDRGAAIQAVGSYGGDLLPDDRYEEWVAERREPLRLRHLELLRLAERWEILTELDPGDERAHLELMRRHAAGGDRHAALRQYERLDRAMRRELGVGPGREATALRDRLLAQAPAPRPDRSLLGREGELAVVERALSDATQGRSATIVLTGAAGLGKTTFLKETHRLAVEQGWRVAHGVSAPVEGSWPYAPVVEALADLCRRHPSLLDGLADIYRIEIDHALSGATEGWSGSSGHQRLFVAAAELVRLAAAGSGLVLSIDDIHEADDASIRLVHYLARLSRDLRVVLILASGTAPRPVGWDDTFRSLTARHGATELRLEPLDPATAEQLVRRQLPDADDGLVDRIVELGDGAPFALAELARRAVGEPDWVRLVDVNTVGGLGTATRAVLQRVAVIGTTFDTDEFAALSGLDEADAFAALDEALVANVVEPTDHGYRFRQGQVREALLDDIPPHRRRLIHREAAARLESLNAAPAQIGHHLLLADETAQAVPYLISAVESAASLGAYSDALQVVESVRPHAAGVQRQRLLVLRADLLSAMGDPTAVSAYREALEGCAESERVLLLARLSRAALMSGDTETAQAALAAIPADVGRTDPELMLARANLAYFTADYETARTVAEAAQEQVLAGDKNWQVLDLVALQGLLAHRRGEWFDRIRVELRRTRDEPEIANSVFDGYLCPAEYLLYGSTPYAEVIDLAHGLRVTAERSGALRAAAFAVALGGEAALLSGDLDTAQAELSEACELHHDLGSRAGEAHCLQRLAEVALARGDRAEARRLLDDALPLARWSLIAMHLMQRIFGTMIAAADDPMHARAIVDRAESTLGVEDSCAFCAVMLSVPAVIACADSGDLPGAERHLAVAERSAALWDGTAMAAALAEAKAHVALVDDLRDDARALLDEALRGFERAGQPFDAARCRASAAAI